MQLIEYYETYCFERRKIDQYLQGGNVSANVPSASEREKLDCEGDQGH